MPLKLLKRSHKQYDVVSKSTFLISVELLDNGVMECTLDTNSTGADCLLNISQRLGLHQPEFFGLRYISRGVPPRQRWADLERPLKKQLEKYAQDSQLSLGVMYYVADVNVLKDEMTRYHYFLQLKSDVIDGKLNCSIDQAISLAAYSLQAEFGDYDPERHTIEYLRDFAILPKELATGQAKYQDVNLEVLYEVVTKQYGSLISFPPPLAEIYYIMVTQTLDGYGQTAFPAKDDSGNDILFCVSAIGFVIRRRDWTHIAAFRFGDIKSLSGNKKVLIVQGTQSQRSIQFHFTDAEVVKYVKKICLLQSDFYKECLKEEQANAAAAASGDANNCANSFSIISGGSSTTTDQMDGHSFSSANLRGMTPELMMQSSSSAIYENQFSLHNNNNVSFNRSGNNSSTSSTSNLMSNFGLNSQILQQQLNFRAQANAMNSGSNLMNQQQQMHGSSKDIQNLQLQLMGSEYRPSMSRSSTPFNAYGNPNMLPQGAGHNFNLSNNNMELQSLLPSYRPAPDYQTAVQLKYGQGASNTQDTSSNGTPQMPSANTSQQYLYGNAAAEEEEPIYENEIVSQIHSMDLRESTTEKSTPRGSLEIIVPSLGPQAQQQLYTILSEEQSSYLYKPPPPYPGTGIRSPSYEPHTILQDGTFTKLRPTLNNHSDVLRLISAQLRESSLSIPSTSTPSSTTPTTAVEVVTSHSQTSAVSLVSSSASASSSKSQKSASKSPEKEASVKHSKPILPSYQKINEHGSISALSSTNTSSNSSLGMNGLGSQQSSASNLSVPPSQVRRGSGTSKNHSKPQLNVGDLYSTSIDPVVLKEYMGIPKAKSMPNFSTALKVENSKRNRCTNILPYEENSVRLSTCRQNQDGYMNASPISVEVGGREWKYIVGQLPLAGNSASLWQMVWEMDVKVIAALERDSTALFYPLDCATSLASSALNTMYFGDFQIVDNKSDKPNTTSIARELTLIYGPKKQQRKVWILPYEDEWKDDVPVHTEHFLCFLEEVNSVQRKVGDPSKPLVVLCGTGAGRSGVLILSDILLHAADSGHKIRCDTLLAALRMQRMLLVSIPAQYAFVLHTLEKYLAQSRLI